jgi:hypothetical protein
LSSDLNRSLSNTSWQWQYQQNQAGLFS